MRYANGGITYVRPNALGWRAVSSIRRTNSGRSASSPCCARCGCCADGDERKLELVGGTIVEISFAINILNEFNKAAKLAQYIRWDPIKSARIFSTFQNMRYVILHIISHVWSGLITKSIANTYNNVIVVLLRNVFRHRVQ